MHADGESWLTQLVRLTDRAAINLPDCTIYLSGSRAVGASRFDSDVDVVIVLPDQATEATAIDLCAELVDHFSGECLKDTGVQVTVPKVARWHDLVRCYEHEAATFGLLFWHHAKLLAGPERRDLNLTGPVMLRVSALHATVRWLTMTLLRLWRRSGSSLITLPVSGFGRAARALLLLKESVWVASYPLALTMLAESRDQLVSRLLDTVTNLDNPRGSITADTHLWASAIDQLARQTLELVPERSISLATPETRMWLHLDRPVPLGTVWQLVPSSAALAQNLADPSQRSHGPWITETLVTLASSPMRSRLSEDALLTYLPFNRYNKWIEGLLAADAEVWAAHRLRCLEYLERLRLVLSVRGIEGTRTEDLHERMHKTVRQPDRRMRQLLMDQWLSVCADLSLYTGKHA